MLTFFSQSVVCVGVLLVSLWKAIIVGVYRLLDRWQGQKDLNPRHAVLEAMLKFLSRSDFTPILGIFCQPRR